MPGIGPIPTVSTYTSTDGEPLEARRKARARFLARYWPAIEEEACLHLARRAPGLSDGDREAIALRVMGMLNWLWKPEGRDYGWSTWHGGVRDWIRSQILHNLRDASPEADALHRIGNYLNAVARGGPSTRIGIFDQHERAPAFVARVVAAAEKRGFAAASATGPAYVDLGYGEDAWNRANERFPDGVAVFVAAPWSPERAKKREGWHTFDLEFMRLEELPEHLELVGDDDDDPPPRGPLLPDHDVPLVRAFLEEIRDEVAGDVATIVTTGLAVLRRRHPSREALANALEPPTVWDEARRDAVQRARARAARAVLARLRVEDPRLADRIEAALGL